ncbi:hypothetical protein NDU88_007655 [Pleurodeles waltl]|uniref:Uncharacterized protein n=1 Tax=Pleurodeles waltl TaxID=8319 RepID=A0AAV7QPF5_PLEWA|nr:hypothetical protein NDU88_007655 [Pleurodeles waltl]
MGYLISTSRLRRGGKKRKKKASRKPPLRPLRLERLGRPTQLTGQQQEAQPQKIAAETPPGTAALTFRIIWFLQEVGGTNAEQELRGEREPPAARTSQPPSCLSAVMPSVHLVQIRESDRLIVS